jgi:hypothetical protein
VPKKPTSKTARRPPANSDASDNSFCEKTKDIDSASVEKIDASGKALKDPTCSQGADILLAQDAETASPDESHLFLHPDSEANFEYWAKLPFWTLEEAIALSLGKNPDLVDWELIQIYRDVSPLAKEFWDRRRLAHRHQMTERLPEAIPLSDFIEWAHQTETDIPIALEEAVSARWQQAVDWKQLFYDQKAYYDDHIAKWKSLCEGLHAERQELAAIVSSLATAIEQRDQSITQLRECWLLLEVARGEDESKVDVEPDKPLHTKERESLLKIVIGLAVRGYGYNPAENRSPAFKQMIDDMADVGISLSVDTLRKFLRLGAEFLPSERGEERLQKKPKRRGTGHSSA